MFNGIGKGLGTYLRSIPNGFKFGLWKYLFYSGLLSFISGSIIIWMLTKLGDDFGRFILSWYDYVFKTAPPGWLENWLGWIVSFILFIFLFKYVIMIVVSPVMSIMSENMENKMLGYKQPQDSGLGRWLKELARGVKIAFRNIIRELALTILLLLLSLIPMAALVTTPLIFLVQAYYAGYGNMDYALERYFNVNETSAFVRENRGFALINGSGFILLLMIPIFGWFFAPFIATIASTEMVVNKLNQRSTNL